MKSKGWIKIKSKNATHYFLKSEIDGFTCSDAIKTKFGELSGMAVSNKNGTSNFCIGNPNFLEAQMLKEMFYK